MFETEPAANRYLAGHPNAPFKTLRDILLSGKVFPSRVRVLMSNIGRPCVGRLAAGALGDHRRDSG